MSKSAAGFILALLTICMVSFVYANSNGDFDAHIRHYQNKHDFQGAVLIAKDGKVLFSQAYGFADREKQISNTLSHQFLIGSLTKSFTATAVMRLVEQGKLQLHAPLAQYIPKLRKELAQKLTLHLLLKHQSGLPNHLERVVDFDNHNVTSTDILNIINTAQLSFEPGSQYRYGNLNYHLAAIAIENVTGQSYPQAMRELVFLPLDMLDSGVERLSQSPKNRAKGYRKSVFGITHDENIMAYALGSGDIYATVQDLLKWDQALYQDAFLSAQSRQLLFAGDTEEFGHYGYGFRVQPYQRQLDNDKHGVLTRHGGSMDGFLANLHRYVDDKLTVIVLGNIRPFPIRDLSFELKEIALGVSVGKRQRKPIE